MQFSCQTKYQSDPAMLYASLCNQKKSTLLFESAEIGNQKGIQSLLVLQSALRISAIDKVVTVSALTENGLVLLDYLADRLKLKANVRLVEQSLIILFQNQDTTLDEESRLASDSIFDVLRVIMQLGQTNDIDEHGIFLAGLFSYDLVAQFEPIPSLSSTTECPDLCFYLAETILVINHQTQTSELKSTLFYENRTYLAQLELSMTHLSETINGFTNEVHSFERDSKVIFDSEMTVNVNDDEYKAIITKLQHSIHQGDIFQVVPSRRFSIQCANSLKAYSILKQTNPSPYMFYMQDELFDLFGASPESALKYTQTNNKVEIYPIAGTKPRGRNAKGEIDLDLDSRLELSMRTDQKELSEHLMLVDLARNDLARISKPGTRYVKELLKVDRYSHVMHLVSHLEGELRSDLDALHAYQATMNMGTLTGSPKVKAMQLIADVEQEKRGSYGGAIGYLNGKGDMDTCIVIRSAYVENGIATIQSGAGIVLDSDPQSEVEETKNKAKAVINAILLANQSEGN